MNNLKKLTFLLLLASTTLARLNICSFTFNSSDERDVLFQELKPLGATLTEFTPQYGKDPQWFDKACNTDQKCDITVFSGHFGGIFFGEGSSITLSTEELIAAKNSGKCKNILENTKAVYLMGCNTLASKKRDHRSLEQYLEVLLSDGFTLNLAEKFAAARYLNYGKSNEEVMSSIFSTTKNLIGFESTGPLGKYAGPLMKKALKNSNSETKINDSVDIKQLSKAFKSTSMKIVNPMDSDKLKLQKQALMLDAEVAPNAWKQILHKDFIDKNLDFIINNKSNIYLKYFLKRDAQLLKSINSKIYKNFSRAKGLTSIQLDFLDFQLFYKLINKDGYNESFKDVLYPLFSDDISFIKAAQLCHIFQAYPSVTKKLDDEYFFSPIKGEYKSYLEKCRGITQVEIKSDLGKCLVNQTDSDWNCLTENNRNLDVNSCLLAASRNQDIENSDDMLWYCYSKLRTQYKLTKASCLELTSNFQILGNKLKMNWNCINRI